ncbi:MAG: translocation/assembly module TamB domain-containing protein [Bacteroidales bacterium]|nr:translocation/assembly module TamB domain-containing protein [Bacteroidales bacterium]MDT8432964.1 translocation/assembly module TamB domain-containing protein [Bacteroidales bacterium]
MGSRGRKYIKRAIKITFWIVVGIVLLLFLIAGLVQVPAIQSRIVHSITSAVSDKTGTTVEIDKVRIAFPKTVVVRGIFLDDLQRDTLLAAGRIKVNIAIRELLFKKINVNSITLEDVSLYVNRYPNDSLFNYHFLIAAFTGTVRPPSEPSPWSFSINRVNLDNIHARHDDRYGGMEITLALQRLRLGLDRFDPGESEYRVNRLVIDGLQGEVVMANHSSRQSTRADLGRLELTNGAVDLENETVTLNKFLLAESGFHMIDKSGEKDSKVDLEQQQSAIGEQQTEKEKSNWKISVDRVDLKNNELNLLTEGGKIKENRHAELDGNAADRLTEESEGKSNIFNMRDLEINLHEFLASDLYYSTEKAGGTIRSFSATDGNGFAVEKFGGVFRFDDQSFAAEKLQFATTHSAIAADVHAQYPSLQMLLDSIASASFTLDLQQLQVKNSDILYFAPQLSKQPFLADPENSTTITGNFSGKLADIKVVDLQIGTGEQTLLNADFTVTGLPEIDSSMVRLPGLSLVSGRQDIRMLAGELVPEGITLPDRLSLQLAFDGMLNEFDAEAELESSFGGFQLSAALNPNESFSGQVDSDEFNIGRLLGDTTMFGPVTVTAEVVGSGLDRSSLKAKVDADVSKLSLNSYVYRGLHIDGTFNDMMFEGRVGLEDENLVFGFDGLVNLQPGEEHYQFRLDLEGASLKELNFSEDDIRIGLVAEADVYGPVGNLQGRIDLSDINGVREEALYVLDSLSAVFSNIPGFSELQVNSKFLEVDYTGTIPPTAIIAELEKFISEYVSLAQERESTPPDDSDENLSKVAAIADNVASTENDRPAAEEIVKEEGDVGEGEELSVPSNFSFTMQLRNHPILSEVFLPGLTSFEPIEAVGQFDSELGLLELDASMKNLVYGAMEISDLTVVADTDSSVVNYTISAKRIATEQVALSNLLFAGNVGKRGIITDVTSVDDDLGKKLAVHTHLTREGDSYRLVIVPDDLFLMYNQWEIDPGNQILFGEEGVMIDRLFLQNGTRELKVASVNRQFNDDLSINISNFRLEDISQIVENDTGLVKGTVNGSILLKKAVIGTSSSAATGIIADASVSNIIFRGVPIGNLAIATTNPSVHRYDLNVTLSGAGNDLNATGHIISSPTRESIDLTADIASFSMKTAEAFSGGQITEAAGTLSGNAEIRGSLNSPEVTGELHFSEVFLKPAVLNNRLQIANETVQLRSDGLYFDSFKITDSNSQPATISGTVKMQAFKDITLALQLEADDFLLMNTTVRDNETVFGRMVIDSDLSIHGPLTLPVVRGQLKLKEGSHATFVVPERRLSTDRGENVVLFEGPADLHQMLEEGSTVAASRSGFTDIDLSTILEIDRKATLRLLMDPTSTDSLVVQGETALSLTMDRSGKISLTGVYTIFEGSYLVSLESVIKRRFAIVQGSSITWNGDPLDATLSIDARYTVRASPYDLVAAQMAGLSDSDKGAYKQQVPFWVILKLRGDMLQPQISFGIELPPEEKGALGGALSQKLVLLNQDVSALNKQVFALLLLGRFMQENPLHTETGSTAAIVRSTVGNFLSAHLNRLGAGVLPGTELNVDIQSYEEYQKEQLQGRTEVEVGIKQQLFNERLSVQVGGSFDVEGERAMQNQASEITGDVRVEYKITEDGRLRLKGFRQNQYEGALEGQIIETGAGVSYVKDFNEWKELFKSPEKKEKDKKKKDEKQEEGTLPEEEREQGPSPSSNDTSDHP